MDAATKKAADREYVDRFFHGVASKLMTHPYFSKFANQANMSAEVPASAAQLDVVLRAVAAEKAEAEAKKQVAASVVKSVERTEVSLDQYEDNMAHVRLLFRKRSDLLEKYKLCKTKDSRVPIDDAIIEIDGMIKQVYATSKVTGNFDLGKYDSITCLNVTPSTPKQTSSWFGPRHNELPAGQDVQLQGKAADAYIPLQRSFDRRDPGTTHSILVDGMIAKRPAIRTPIILPISDVDSELTNTALKRQSAALMKEANDLEKSIDENSLSADEIDKRAKVVQLRKEAISVLNTTPTNTLSSKYTIPVDRSPELVDVTQQIQAPYKESIFSGRLGQAPVARAAPTAPVARAAQAARAVPSAVPSAAPAETAAPVATRPRVPQTVFTPVTPPATQVTTTRRSQQEIYNTRNGKSDWSPTRGGKGKKAP